MMRDKNIDHPLRVRRLKCWRLRKVRPTAHSPNGQCVIAANGDTAKKGLKRLAIEGILRYCRYDGGRASTALSPGKINGWVILSGVGGTVTHTVEKDAEGNIILVPVEAE